MMPFNIALDNVQAIHLSYGIFAVKLVAKAIVWCVFPFSLASNLRTLTILSALSVPLGLLCNAWLQMFTARSTVLS